jgi:hypothetical protein
MKMLSAREERQRAKDAAWYARVELRRREENSTIQVESRAERWQQQAEETATARTAEKDQRQHVVERRLREERRHEVALATAAGAAAAEVNAVVDTGTLEAIGTILTRLLDRVESIEARIGKLEGSNDGRRFTARLDALAARDEKSGRKMSAIEKRADQEHELVHDLQVEVKILKARIHAMEKKPQPQDLREVHVIHHGQ